MRKSDTRIIVVESCSKCPYMDYEDGKGMGDGYYRCNHEKGPRVLMDEDTWFDLDKIHPKCPLNKKET